MAIYPSNHIQLKVEETWGTVTDKTADRVVSYDYIAGEKDIAANRDFKRFRDAVSSGSDITHWPEGPYPSRSDIWRDYEWVKNFLSKIEPKITHCEYCGTKTFPEDRCCVACGAPA